ncbi:MAG: hypothetical protein KatS3mg131_2490 [Candidatus Tectimicrobiota bacterium]|nr:MAG: hypothetical protein KatS3mg131_2490 [Candidatus Tectomicrobia bacterium]
MEPSLSCEQCEDLLADYALQALTPQEAEPVAVHLATCPRCQASLAAYEDTLTRLAQAVPQYSPPPALWRRLRRRLPAPPLVSRPRRGRRALAVAAGVVLLLGAAWGAWQAQREVVRLRQQWQVLRSELEVQRRALAFLTLPEVRQVSLRSDGGRARGVLLWHPEATQAVLIVQDLPPLAPDRVYQLWLLWDGKRDNGGIFRVDARGFGLLEVHAPKPLAAYQAAGITAEPAGGSPGPTSPRLLGGRL